MIVIDQQRADSMLGKVVLVGVTFHDAAGHVVEDKQFFGAVLRINAREGLVISNGLNGQEVSLPPELERYTPADPGEYRLRSSGHVVVDPDFVSTWKRYPPQPESSGAP